MDDKPIFDSKFLEELGAILRELEVPEDIGRIYLRYVPLVLMGIDEETAKKLACRMEAAAQEAPDKPAIRPPPGHPALICTGFMNRAQPAGTGREWPSLHPSHPVNGEKCHEQDQKDHNERDHGEEFLRDDPDLALGLICGAANFAAWPSQYAHRWSTNACCWISVPSGPNRQRARTSSARRPKIAPRRTLSPTPPNMP
jgi:hypothetical protein